MNQQYQRFEPLPLQGSAAFMSLVCASMIYLGGSNDEATRRRQGRWPHWDLFQKPWTQIQDILWAPHHPVRTAWLKAMTDCRIRTFYSKLMLPCVFVCVCESEWDVIDLQKGKKKQRSLAWGVPSAHSQTNRAALQKPNRFDCMSKNKKKLEEKFSGAVWCLKCKSCFVFWVQLA